MYWIKIFAVSVCLGVLISSNTLAQPPPKIGVAAVKFYLKGRPVRLEDIKDPMSFRQMVTNVTQYIASDLKYQTKGADVREFPFRLGWKLEDYRNLAIKEGLDILLSYDIKYIPKPTLGIRPPDTIVNDATFDGRLMLVKTGEIWGRISAERPGAQKDWIAKLAKETGKAVPVWYHIRSNPSSQICCIDGEVKGLTPRDFSAFRVIGSITSIEVHFDNPKGTCRRKDNKIEHREQIIKEIFKPRDPEKPPCQSDKSGK